MGMVNSASLSFGLYPMLTSGACLSILNHASQELKEQYLPNMYAGTWAGSMCLTEPHCGTDLGIIRTKAEPQADGSYKISGTKIFITMMNYERLGVGIQGLSLGERSYQNAIEYARDRLPSRSSFTRTCVACC